MATPGARADRRPVARAPAERRTASATCVTCRPRRLVELVLFAGARHRDASGRSATAVVELAGLPQGSVDMGQAAIVDVGERHRAGDRARRRRRHPPRRVYRHLGVEPSRLQDDRDEDSLELPVHEGDHDDVRPRRDSRPDTVGRDVPAVVPHPATDVPAGPDRKRGDHEPSRGNTGLVADRSGGTTGTSRDNYIHRSWMKRGLPDDAFSGKPMIGICNSASELTPVQPTPRRPGRATSSGASGRRAACRSSSP